MDEVGAGWVFRVSSLSNAMRRRGEGVSRSRWGKVTLPTRSPGLHLCVILRTGGRWDYRGMRVNLISEWSSTALPVDGAIPLSLTIRPACGLPGEYVCPTDSTTLLRMLSQRTDLPSSVLRRFQGDLFATSRARLLAVELNDQVLTEIGYFVD